MADFTFNQQLPILGKKFPQPRGEDLPLAQYKYGLLAIVYANTTDYVREILDSVELKNQHNRVVVDIKVTDIIEGKPPCLPGWHCDTVIDPLDDTLPEVHHLFVSGSASLTEFIASPVTLQIKKALKQQKLLADLRKQLEKIDYKVWKIPSCTLAEYGRFHFHRGSIGRFSEKRLLIRVTETNVVVPRNRPLD